MALLLVLGAGLLVLGISLERVGGHDAHSSVTAEAAEHSEYATSPHDERAEQAERGGAGHDDHAEPNVTPTPTHDERAESPLNQVLESPAALGGFVVVSIALATAVWRRPIRPVLAVVAVFALVAAVFDIRELGYQLTAAHPGLAALTGLIAATRLAILAGTAQLWRAS